MRRALRPPLPLDQQLCRRQEPHELRGVPAGDARRGVSRLLTEPEELHRARSVFPCNLTRILLCKRGTDTRPGYNLAIKHDRAHDYRSVPDVFAATYLRLGWKLLP